MPDGLVDKVIAKLKATDARRLHEEYQRLVSGLASGGALGGGALDALERGIIVEADEARQLAQVGAAARRHNPARRVKTQVLTVAPRIRDGA